MASTPFLQRSSSEESIARSPSPRFGPAGSARSFRIRPVYVIGVTLFCLAVIPFTHSHSRALVSSYLTTQYTHTATYPLSQVPPPTGGVDESEFPLTLDARISYLLGRPALHHGEASLPNRHKCPYGTFHRDEYFFHQGRLGQWDGVSPDGVREYRKILVEHLREVERSGEKVVWDPEMDAHIPTHLRRGLIMSVADEKRLESALLSIHMLRNVFHSTLPVEIFHFVDELQDQQLREKVAAQYNVKFVQVDGRNTHAEKAWNIKNIAFLRSSFTEFIWLDSDNILLIDPAELFDGVEYRQSGSAFWPDLYKDHPDNAIWRILGRDCSDQHWPAETGQMIFDKRGNNGLNLAVLHIANHMMIRDDLYGFLSFGDKDTFRYGFYALGLHYQQAPRMFSPAGGYQDISGKDGDFNAHSMFNWALTPPSAAHDPHYHSKPAFMHANIAKLRSGLQPTKLWSHVRHARLDGINEPKLVRAYYYFDMEGFHITLIGPDGLPGVENSALDGQGVLTTPLQSLLAEHIWTGLGEVAEKYANLNS